MPVLNFCSDSLVVGLDFLIVLLSLSFLLLLYLFCYVPTPYFYEKVTYGGFSDLCMFTKRDH